MFKHVYADGNVKTLAELVQDDRPITYGVIKPGAFVETGTYLVKVKDMCDGKINVDGLVKITPEVDSMYSRSKLKEGDILLSIRGTVGRVVIVPKELEGANITQDTARISLKIGLNNYYVKCVLESPTIQDWISMHICGLAVKGINLADVRKIPIPMADDSLQKDYVNIYHQADKSGFVVSKSRFIEMFDFGDESLYRPWGELFETQLGKMLDQNKQKSDNTSCRYLANINVQWGYFDLTDLKSMTFNEKEIEKFALNVNDLLICEGGDAGRCAVWKESNSEIKYQKAIHRARPIDGSIIDVNYVQYYLHYYKKSGKLADFITKGTIEHLTGEKLNKVPVLVPPIDLQHQFTAFVEQADKSGLVN